LKQERAELKKMGDKFYEWERVLGEQEKEMKNKNPYATVQAQL